MPIIDDILKMVNQDGVLAGKLGLDSKSNKQRFNLVMALKQIEAAALGYKEKPLEQIRKTGFDINFTTDGSYVNSDFFGLGYDGMMQLITSGEAAAAANKVGLDSQALYRATELTFFDPRFFEIEHKKLMFRETFPITHMGDPADKAYTYKMERLVGTPNFTGEDGTTHYKVDVIEEDTTVNYHKIEVEFEITTDDMYAAIKTGRPIEVRKMKAAFRSAEQQMNDAVIIGVDKPKLLGFIKHPDIIEDEVAEGASGTGDKKLWEQKTPEEILIEDIGSRVAIMDETTFGWHKPTDLGLPRERYNYLSQRWIQTGTYTMPISLLKWLLDNIDTYGIKRIHPMDELNGSGPGGSNMGILWDNESDVVEIDISQELTWLAPQFVGTKIKFFGVAKISDMLLRRKQGARRFTGF